MITDHFLVTDQVAIVTGAGRGIGAAIARTYAEVGANVVLAARTESQLEEVAEKVRSHGRRALVVPTDVDDEERLAALADTAARELGLRHVDERGETLEVVRVARDGDGPATERRHLRRDLVELGLGARRDHDVGARLGERLDDRPTDAS